jgi:DNA-binding NtrC family response regulator
MAIILVVDDEVGIRELLSEILIDEGYDVRLAENASRPPGAQRTAPRSGPARHLDAGHRRHFPAQGMACRRAPQHAGGDDVRHGTIDTAVEATRFGAFDFLEKPIALQKLLSYGAEGAQARQAAGRRR